MPPLVPKPSQSYGFSLDSDEREDESTGKARHADDSRERKEKVEEAQRPSWERRTSADDRRKRREDSEPRLFISCDENQEPPEGNDKSGKSGFFDGLNLKLYFSSSFSLGSSSCLNDVSVLFCAVQRRARPL